MRLLYSLGIYLYYLTGILVSVFHKKAAQWTKAQHTLFSELERKMTTLKTPAKRIWIHCASLGEFEQGRPIIELIKENEPDTQIILTFFSPSGYTIRKDYPLADLVSYLPLDTQSKAKRFVSLLNPDLVVFIKYEYWYYLLRECKQRGIPTYLLSAYFRPCQIFFKPYGGWFFKLLTHFTHLFVQDEESATLLRSKDSTLPVTVNGDTRFDRVAKIASESQEIAFIREFCQQKKVLIAGSTWAEDEEILSDYINQADCSVQYIIAPHEIEAHKIKALLSRIHKGVITYTDRKQARGDEQVLVLDTIGLLSSCYKYGHIAYIGGGFGKGIHNILEAATFGLPVIFGPNHTKFKEAIALKKEGGAFSITDKKTFRHTVTNLLEHAEELSEAGKKARQYVKQNTGGTQHFYRHISEKNSY